MGHRQTESTTSKAHPVTVPAALACSILLKVHIILPRLYGLCICNEAAMQTPFKGSLELLGSSTCSRCPQGGIVRDCSCLQHSLSRA